MVCSPARSAHRGCSRIADGDFSHEIHVSGSGHHAALAATFNAMRTRLAAAFDLVEHDREQLRAILSGMVEGVIAIDDERRMLFANEKAGELLGFDPKPSRKSPLPDVTRHLAFIEIVEKGLAGTGPHREELELKGPPQRSLTVYVSRFRGHGAPGAVIVLDDKTDIRQAEQMRQDFVANVSHELKTPLAVIKSSVETLVDGAAEEPEARGRVPRADHPRIRPARGAHSGPAQPGADRVRATSAWNRRRSPWTRAITDCVERHQMRAETKTLTMVEKPPKDVPANVTAWADPDALRQVMDNLVDNAIKYTPNGGRITVRWSATPETVSFEVEDTGVGIPAADLPRVFERFYRVDKARSRAEGGTGLGLAIVKHLAQAMKGHVRVASTVGKGTTFRVTLPRGICVRQG